MVTKQEIFELGKNLSRLANGNGEMGFSIKYTATEGNLKVHEDFIKFCYDESNNEYLMGIKFLLDSYKNYVKLEDVASYVVMLESRVKELEDKVVSLSSVSEVKGKVF